MYGIDGRRDLTESTLDDLSGYAGARPVRIGNGAFDQRQNDVFGAVLDSILLHTQHSDRLPRSGCGRSSSHRPSARREVWREPRPGDLGGARRAAALRLVEAHVLGRARPSRQARGDPRLIPRRQEKWRSDRRRDPRGHPRARRPNGGVLRQHYETDSLDASTLLAAIFGFLPGDDERLRKSVEAIADDLTEDGFVLRYRTDETDDGLSGKEGTFLICSFWLVSALAIVGELQRARDLMERLLRVASPLGLYAEEFDAATGRHLGNFPQAFSHLALIEAAARIIVPEMLAEYYREERHEHAAAATGAIRSTVPARLDRLSWSPFHTRMVAGLGAAWILDGLQITISSSVDGGAPKARHARDELDARSASSRRSTCWERSSARSCSGGCPTSSAASAC